MHEIVVYEYYLILKYLCLNKFCNCAHVVSPRGSREWYHSLASPNSVRQNLCTFISTLKWWASIQSFECSRCASASSSGFPKNSGLKFDQLRCISLCPTASWGWGCSCPCLWLGAAAPSSLFAIISLYTTDMLHSFSLQLPSFLSIPNMINLLGQSHKFQLVPDTWIWWFLKADGKIVPSSVNWKPFPVSTWNPYILIYWQFSKFFNWDFSLLLFYFWDSGYLSSKKIFFNMRDSFFLIFKSQMSPHVMYCSARCE